MLAEADERTNKTSCAKLATLPGCAAITDLHFTLSASRNAISGHPIASEHIFTFL